MNKSFAAAVAAPTALIASLSASQQADAAMITFEQFAGDIAGQSAVLLTDHSVIQESGFTLTDTVSTGGLAGFAALGDQSPSYTGSVALQNSYLDTSTLTRTDGGVFDLVSIDLEKFGTQSDTLTFTGTTATGQTVFQDFLLPGNPDFVLDTYSFSNDFNNVTSVSWTFDTDFSYQFDNISANNVSSVPVPGALGLMATGLAGLAGAGVLRRRRESASEAPAI